MQPSLRSRGLTAGFLQQRKGLHVNTDDAIRQRRTEKVLATSDLPARDMRTVVDELLNLAGQAPFHRSCEEAHRRSGSLTGIEPWRFYALGAKECRSLRSQLPRENAGKIPSMLAAADALIMATWLPNGAQVQMGGEDPLFPLTLNNMEHIAATAAAIQNLLLAATARGISNYWSSGGVLRSASVFQRLGIPMTEILLGAIFLFPKDYAAAEMVTSKMRDLRTPAQHWSRWIALE